MVRFLLLLVFNPFPKSISQTSAWVKIAVLPLFVFLMGAQAFGQQIDTWFRAGKGINLATNGIPLYSPNPLPPADGTIVNTWFDVVYFSEQNAIPNPAPADYSQNPFGVPPGFDYPFPNSGGFATFLTPGGSIPGTPTFRRNPTSNINFNPVIEFDGSGDGQALHFRSNSRGEVTVFVVFKALGAGNSAETQRLLFGGDVDVHHRSFNISNWTTNLSLGIANDNHFSVGRTWHNDGGGFYEEGSIDLNGEPTIGAFSRASALGSETLSTFVNGIAEISTIRNHILAGNDLFFFNRLGKHFNSNDSNRNLTGDIAEVLLADFAMNNNERQRVESYLAIKYGITLSNGAQLGSIGGNGTYNYLAADGTIIWSFDPIYQFDIAGIGKDRYRDVFGTTSLRYNIDQRISKSINSDAIVTISTNTDFVQDNLDLTRPEIDAQITSKPAGVPYDHNYLIWANDNGSINEILAELPTGITSRLEREWRVQAIRSIGVDQITGVSVRVNLSGSDILNNGNCLKLLIDTDGNGDFSDGPITIIDATSIDVLNNVYFDGVDFEHQDVFTIGSINIDEPTVSFNTPICSGENAVFTISGNADNEVSYNINGATTTTATIGAGGTVDVTVNAVTSNTTINLTNISDGICDRTLTISEIVTVNALPTAALGSSDANDTICAGDSVTFTATGGDEYEFYVDGTSVQAQSTTATYTTTTLADGQ
ncbi:hypothetical protein, partial [Flagellimonas pacifica]